MELEDETDFGLKLDDPSFPSYLRLFRYILLDTCLVDTTNALLDKFKFAFNDDDHERLIYCMRYPEDEIRRDKPDMNVPQLDKASMSPEEYEVKSEYRRKYIEDLTRKAVETLREDACEFFLNTALSSYEGIKAADQIFKLKKKELYDHMHLKKMPADWGTRDDFFKKFSEPDDEEMSGKILDTIRPGFYGDFVLRFFEEQHQEGREINSIRNFLNKFDNMRSEVMRKFVYCQRTKDGPFDFSLNRSLLVLAAFPYVKTNDLPEEKRLDWFYNLMHAMSQDPYNRCALNYIDSNWYEVLARRQDEENAANMRRNRNVTNAEILINQVAKVTELRPQPERPEQEFEDDTGIELVLRGYQSELVQPALLGENVVIVAPTGAGKTEVAIKAAFWHIEQNDAAKKPSRVVLLVPKIPLVDQQRKRFLKYCGSKYVVQGFHGSEGNDGNGRTQAVLESNIVVMTPQILLNMWSSVRENERLYICDFSMIIFDEVHRTTGNHPYALIAEKIQTYEGTKPQIVGLTASLNVSSNNPDHQRMEDDIYQLLAMLSATSLSTVRDENNKQELDRHVPKPDDEISVCKSFASNESPFREMMRRSVTYLNRILTVEIESISKGYQTSFVLPKHFLERARKFDNPHNNQDTRQYLNFLREASTMLNKVGENELEVDSTLKTSASMAIQHLNAFTEAREIIEVMPTIVAFEFLHARLSKLRTDAFESYSNGFFKDRDTLLESIRNAKDPEIVTQLKTRLQKEFEANPASRALIFVEQRSTAERVCAFLNECGILRRSMADPEPFGYIVGTNSNSGMTASIKGQKETIQKFAEGKLKVLVATSVAEEGLDIRACNLVIKYNCASNSAVQLIQRRGRVRDSSGKSIFLVVATHINERENNAMLAERNMRQCVRSIQRTDPHAMKERIALRRQHIEKEREIRKRQEMETKKLLEHNRYQLKCKSCSSHITYSYFIKRYVSSYIISDPDIWKRVSLVPKPWKKIKVIDEDTHPLKDFACKRCNIDKLGKVFKQAGTYVPQLTASSVIFHKINGTVVNPEGESMNKWATAETKFWIESIDDNDLVQMILSIQSPENDEIRRKLDQEYSARRNEMERMICLANDREEERMEERQKLEDAE